MDMFRNKPMLDILSLKRMTNQGTFLKRLGTLLEEGFSLKEALSFLSTIGNKEKKEWIVSIHKGLEKGHQLHEELEKVQFSERICSQLYFSLVHGHFSQTIRLCGDQLIEQNKKKKKLIQIVNYPIILLVFMIGMLFSMRYILLPHINRIVSIEETSMGWISQSIIFLVYTSPYWLTGLVVGLLLLLVGVKVKLRNKTMLEKIDFYSKIPFLKSYLTLYWTQFFTWEWGQLLKNGCNLLEIVSIMQAKDSSVFLQEAGQWMEQELSKGRGFSESLEAFHFMKSEVREIISHGELSGRLGSELMLFSIECEEELTQRTEQLMERIQPLVFISVAFMIIAIYAALLLPTFSLMEGL